MSGCCWLKLTLMRYGRWGWLGRRDSFDTASVAADLVGAAGDAALRVLLAGDGKEQHRRSASLRTHQLLRLACARVILVIHVYSIARARIPYVTRYVIAYGQ